MQATAVPSLATWCDAVRERRKMEPGGIEPPSRAALTPASRASCAPTEHGARAESDRISSQAEAAATLAREQRRSGRPTLGVGQGQIPPAPRSRDA
jgi:hypothetical protein